MPNPEITRDFDKLRDDLALTFTEGLNTLLDGASNDISTFGVAIAENVVDALTIADTGRRQAILDELYDQATLLLPEVTRLRAQNIYWDKINAAVKMAMRSAVSAALAM